MSDSIEDLVRIYNRNVSIERHPRSIGLFTIPEYPEYVSKRGMWSTALDAILTTLRYLAPATLLTLFWGQQSFLFKILKHIDSAFRAIVFSSEEQKQAVLIWLAEAGPVRVEHLDTVWRHGWILCGVLDAALPGACAGHPPTRLSLKHAQAIAEHYLGVDPVFSRQELESNDSLSKHQEWKLANYLDRIREALTKLTPPVSKTTPQKTNSETTQFTLDYVAKGSGLTAAQINNKMYFKIYPTSQQSLDPGEITILIRGPKDTYGMIVLPPLLGKAQLIRQKLLGLQSKQSYTENVLPITQGAAYLRSYGKNDMNKTYYIPKTKYDIDINVETKSDHTKISYEVNLEGKYEIFITSRGQNIVGSPFMVTASHNILGILEKDSFCLEDGEEIDIVDVKNDRKVVLRIVDFVTEKMLLKENGSLEKISDEEANMLMATGSKSKNIFKPSEVPETVAKEECKKVKSNKFNKAANKVIKMKRVCKIMHELMKQSQIEHDTTYIQAKSQQYIPDIVNSTFSDINTNPFIINEKRNKYIVPESISVSLRTEKSIPFIEEMNHPSIESNKSIESFESESNKNTPDSLEQSNASQDDLEDDVSIDRMTPLSGNNPFLSDISEENFIKEKDLGTFVTSEFETNNSQNEEITNSIQIVIDPYCTPSVSPNNPFIDDHMRDIGRPKSPVFRTMLEQSQSLDGSIYPKSELIPEEMLGNEFVNPFFTHHHHQPHEQLPITDFIIGAPVSLPPILRASSPEPNMRSLIITRNEKSDNFKIIENKHRREAKIAEISPLVHKTSRHTNLDSRKEDSNTENMLSESPTFQSLESNLTETIETSTASSVSDGHYEPYRIEGIQDRNVTPTRKDTWDSAYVSIDDPNSSPDNNNNDNTTVLETNNKQKISPSDENYGLNQEDLSNMGPAEREIWQICSELNEPKMHEDIKPHKMEVKRPSFTPILEETDKIISSGTKDITGFEKDRESDPVTVAFAELNDMYTEYFPGSDTESTIAAVEDNKIHSIEVDYTVEGNKLSVDSASEEMSDVKRHVDQIEGAISEVQSNVAESVSVSQTLLDETKQSRKYPAKTKDETQFGDSSRNNIVLERKKYWDEKIRQIEAKSQESSFLPKKKRITAKQMKHDSLSKRKGKQMIKNFLNAGGYNQAKIPQICDEKQMEILQPQSTIERLTEQHSTEPSQGDEKLVEKWKKYWDDKLEKEHIEIETPIVNSKNPTSRCHSVSPAQISSREIATSTKLSPTTNGVGTTTKNQYFDDPSSSTPVRQELPEELFKAFETSPKRFFGTSRKQILNKIDSFTGRSSSEDSSPEVSEISYDSGLVSSRISLFHNLSHTEELPWARRKSKSMHNIYQRKRKDKTDSSPEPKSSVSQEQDNVKITIEKEIKMDKKEDIYTKASGQDVKITIKEKRAQISNHTFNKSIEDISTCETPSEQFDIGTESAYITKSEVLRRKSFSKSEMDIFNKIPNEPTDDYLDKYKSCDELPKINVKNFISLYESASKPALDSKPPKQVYRTSSVESEKLLQTISKTRDAVKEHDATDHRTKEVKTPSSTELYTLGTPKKSPRKLVSYKSIENVDSEITDKSETESLDIKIIKDEGKETTYVSLSDIELEIVESSPEKSSESSPERITVAEHIEYKNRFKMAKQYFQSLEELREIRKPRKLNECEMLLKQSSESPETDPEPENTRPRRKKLKSHSMPSSEISKVWSQLQDSQRNEGDEAGSSKLMKISEKFNVDDLFTDVMEGRLSRQGSLRGIPHKKAVLEAFRSMENISNNQINSYEITDTQLNDFTEENRVKSAQTYLSEYPYLPMTDPSKYHSRLDVKASGLISFKELLGKRPRRNSVPDLRLNPKFEEDL